MFQILICTFSFLHIANDDDDGYPIPCFLVIRGCLKQNEQLLSIFLSVHNILPFQTFRGLGFSQPLDGSLNGTQKDLLWLHNSTPTPTPILTTDFLNFL